MKWERLDCHYRKKNCRPEDEFGKFRFFARKSSNSSNPFGTFSHAENFIFYDSNNRKTWHQFDTAKVNSSCLIRKLSFAYWEQKTKKGTRCYLQTWNFAREKKEPSYDEFAFERRNWKRKKWFEKKWFETKLFLENGEIACVKKGGDAFENSRFCAKNIEKLKINLVVVKKFKIRVVRISRFGWFQKPKFQNSLKRVKSVSRGGGYYRTIVQ